MSSTCRTMETLSKKRRARRGEQDEQALYELSNRIKRIRLQKGLSQLELSLRLGCSPHYVSDIENMRRNPSFLSLLHIAEALGVGIEDLLIG